MVWLALDGDLLNSICSRSVFHMSAIQKHALLWSIQHHDTSHWSLTVTEYKWQMKLISAFYCGQIINKLLCMNRTARHDTKCSQVVHKLITSFHSKRYQPSGILIHRQNSYAPRDKQCTGRREAVNKVKKNSVGSWQSYFWLIDCLDCQISYLKSSSVVSKTLKF
jgi:hypothetical protein